MSESKHGARDKRMLEEPYDVETVVKKQKREHEESDHKGVQGKGMNTVTNPGCHWIISVELLNPLLKRSTRIYQLHSEYKMDANYWESNQMEWYKNEFEDDVEAILTLASMGFDQDENLEFVFRLLSGCRQPTPRSDTGYDQVWKLESRAIERNIARCFQQCVLSSDQYPHIGADRVPPCTLLDESDPLDYEFDNDDNAIWYIAEIIHDVNENFVGKDRQKQPESPLINTFMSKLLKLYSPLHRMELSRHTCHFDNLELEQYLPKAVVSIVVQYSGNNLFVGVRL